MKERCVFRRVAGEEREVERHDRPDRAIIGDPTDQSERASLTSL